MKRIIAPGLATCALLFSGVAFGQIYPFPTQSGAAAVAATIAAGGGTSTGITGAVEVRAVGTATVTAINGTRIPVPAAATATVSKAAMAKAAARLVAGAGILGAAYQTYEVYNWIKNQGIATCPPPAFFCKSSQTNGPVVDPTASTGWLIDPTMGTTGSLQDAARTAAGYYAWGSFSNGTKSKVLANYQIVDSMTATAEVYNQYSDGSRGAFVQTVSMKRAASPPVGSPYTQQELESGLIGEGTNWDPSRSQAMRDAILRDNAKQNVLTKEEITPPASPLKYDPVPATTASPIVTKTETFKNPDGSTTTRTTTETTTVNASPAPAPGTVGSPVTPKYETSTKTEVKDRNDATGVETVVGTSVTTSVPAQSPEQPKLELPDDYARQPTLQNIEKSLSTEGAAEMPDQEKRVSDGVKQAEDALKTLRDAIPGEQAGADKDRFFSWVWTPPVGACTATQAATLSNGAVVNFDICPTVNNIRDVLGWLFALFGAIEVYSQLFKKND